MVRRRNAYGCSREWCVMTKKSCVFLWSLFAVLLVFPLSSPFAAASGCVSCHTNPELLKSLYKPPVIAAGAGEG